MPDILSDICGLVDLLWDSQCTNVAQRSLVHELQSNYWPEKFAVPELMDDGDPLLFRDTNSLQRKEELVGTEIPGECLLNGLLYSNTFYCIC